MKKFTTTIVMILLFSLTTNAQNDFEKLWQQVEKFEVDGLPKSALKIVEEIYTKAEKTNNSSQIIKSLFYKSKFSLTLEEDAQLKVIHNFKEQIAKNVSPTKNVLENVLANLYWQYFTQNRYKFYNRTKTQDKVDVNDFRTWDLDTLFEEIHTYFKASLQEEKLLQKIRIDEFSDILQLQHTAKIYTPTLFDFLANNALQFYKSSETSITKPSYQFTIDSSDYLSDAKTFSTLKITSKDSLSLELNALKIYQKLLHLHSITNNKNAFANIDVQRINFVYQNATFENKDRILLETLKTSEENFKNDEASGLYAFEIAQIYKNKAKNKEALAICNAVIKDFPKSLGAQKCFVLKNQIEQKMLSILAEEYIPIDKNSRLLVTYKNVEKLFFTGYKINQKQLEEFNKIYKFDDKKAFINTLEKLKTWNHKLRNENDYLEHSTEVIVPKFESGMYLILASENGDLNENSVYGTTTIQVTNLTLIENTFDGTYNYQVVDRTTGKPIKNAEIHLKNSGNNEDFYINKKVKTDKNGFASIETENYLRNVEITVKTQKDFANFGKHYFYNHNSHNSENIDNEITIKPFIFTDRSIYRPGQIVYFKTIVIKKQGDKSEVFKNEFVEVTLYDVNNQIVKTLDLKLNDFGSVAGEFIIPNNGLTGEFTIDVDESSKQESKFYQNADFDMDYNNSVTISVEEYKRPKFETEFKPITESFKINDSIKINGFAKAFSGANITDAKVVYRVHRKVQYPSWYYWRRPNPTSNSQEITNGESITDASGNFFIKFKAIPDESVDKESLPIFNYEITADVTDINGETRSATTIVKVGYHSLIASILVDDKIDKNQKETIVKIETKNLNDEFVAAKGIIKIYKLQAPKNPLRKRPWSAPDYQDISENEFRKLFPNDPYTDDESDEKNWKKGALVFTEKFDTASSKKIILKNTKSWLSGKYIIVLESEDKFGQEVKDEKRITIFSSKDKNVADNQLFTINTNKTFYNVGDQVEIQLGSASKDMTVIVQIEKNHKIIDTKIIKLNNCVETIKIPIKKEDVGGFAVKYHYVNYNYFESGNLLIKVPEKQESIEIITNIFRDKLQPGQDETWSFTIKDDKNDAFAAEVLASMYDVSLDDFKAHNWNFNPIAGKQSYSSYQTSNANKSFGNTSFYIKNNEKNYYQIPTIGTSSYNWFGFSLNNNRWLNQQYLRETKNKINSTRTDFDGIVTGLISNKNGEPLPGVNVQIKGTSFGTTTDFDGNYSIKIKKGDVLVVNYLGYESVEYLIDSQTNIDVSLEEDSSQLDEVVVTGYGRLMKKSEMTSSVSMAETEEANYDSGQPGANSLVQLRGVNSLDENSQPLYVVDGVIVDSFDENGSNITNISILKEATATALYGSRGANGVVIITTKAGQEKIDAALSQVQARKNFKETAFFYPQLKTDKEGKVSFSFTMPEALTRWKLQLLAHSTDLKSATKTLQTVTQKELMVVPNAPRFLREKDTITLSAKITNLTNNQLNGFAKLILTDAISGKEINTELQNLESNKNFVVDKDGNTNVSWNLAIPENMQAVQYKIVAKAGDFSDGEQNVLPVLTNRMLVTETLPMFIKSNETKTFTLDKLKNSTSSTLKNHKLTLEMTSNPVWVAVQALPYLMEYPYDCSEQIFSRYYANTLASFVANSNPKIQDVFNAWKSSDALLSNLEKNQELKSLIIQETPWLRDAQSETEQKKRIALLFDLNTMKNNQEKAIKKLQENQLNS
ncbi:MAG: carboxypeptidase-like regulatory domain-containing protein, partial [Flavobacteriales bacterium]